MGKAGKLDLEMKEILRSFEKAAEDSLNHEKDFSKERLDQNFCSVAWGGEENPCAD